MMAVETLRSISQALDAIHSERPKNLSERVSPIVRELSSARDELRRALQGDTGSSSRSEMNRINQALSLVHSVAYPVGAIPWDHLTEASKLLRG